MKQTFKMRLEKLEKKSSTTTHERKKTALILCDSELPADFNDFEVDADVVLILPDNGRGGLGKKAPKSSYSIL